MPEPAPSRTVAFLGASGGVGLAALRRTLANGYRCVALCRDPSKLTAIFPEMDLNLEAQTGLDDTMAATRRLTLVRGNAHDVDAVARCLLVPGTTDGERRIVDCVVSTIGGKFILSKLTVDDPNVCANGMATLLAAIKRLRLEGVSCSGPSTPRIVVVSTTGISKCGRDVPLALLPLYHGMLRVPHADKCVMEETLVTSGEMFAIVRPSLLVDYESEAEAKAATGANGGNDGRVFLKQLAETNFSVMSKGELEVLRTTTKDELGRQRQTTKEEVKALEDKLKKEHMYKNIRVGIEDPIANKRISSTVGYTISRADAGRWLAENLVFPAELPANYARHIATITY
ncbi:hypothetical protein HMPREF1624_06737 [Sporothrix schenckii ATCC 58251]|uniref:NAD(P)-binding domain-containing protein n=1 Tax=Sporothrix schenckii (strain ATCC 58251 / de Perez 2211183) TaxID=1391915 RepID=U7PLL3_SPOS1|nr:hypothetical protein HMPREF1624_06737 [Sporothrix schenckii ATCC 58251]